jgi:hypothetical protein
MENNLECRHDHHKEDEIIKEEENITTFRLGDENHPVDENDEVLLMKNIKFIFSFFRLLNT